MWSDRTPSMLYDLPAELLFTILRFLPQSDLCVTARTSKHLHAASLQSIDAAKCTNIDELNAFLSAMLDTPNNLRPRWLHCLELRVRLSRTGGLDVDEERLIHLLERATNITTLSLSGLGEAYRSFQSRIIDAILSLPFLHSLALPNLTHKAALGGPDLLSRLPADGLHTLHLHFSPASYFHFPPEEPGPIDFRNSFLSSISHLTRLRTLTLVYPGRISDNDALPPHRLTSVRNLIIDSSRIESLSTLLTLFPSIDSLELIRVAGPLQINGDAPLRLARLKACMPTLYHTASSSWYGIEVAHLEMPLHTLGDPTNEYLTAVTDFAGDMSGGFPLGLSVQIPCADRYWLVLAASFPALRWLEIQVSTEAFAGDILEVLVAPGRHWPFRILYLNVIFPAAISLVRPCQAIERARADAFSRRDETVCEALVETLPRCIPTLRYLTVSRSFSLLEDKEVRRTRRCYRVADDRCGLEIPEWEGKRVREYCRNARDPEAFDKFDERFVPLR